MEKNLQEVVENPSGLTLPEVQKLDEKIGNSASVNLVENSQEQQQSDQFQLRSEIGTIPVSETTQIDGKLDQASGYIDRPQISVKGFEQSGVMTNEEVQRYLKNTLPPEHISSERITEISYPNQYQGDDNFVTLGLCSTDTTGISKIEIFNQTPEGSNNLDGMEKTLIHEVGHNVYWNMPQEQRDNWSALNNSSRPDEFVTSYAQTNEKEDFAESYATYIRDPELLQEVSQKKFDFIRNFVFSGRQYA